MSQVEIIKRTTTIVEVAHPGLQGASGAAGSEVVISATDPQLATPPKAGPFLWVQPDETGALNDIYWVPA